MGVLVRRRIREGAHGREGARWREGEPEKEGEKERKRDSALAREVGGGGERKREVGRDKE